MTHPDRVRRRAGAAFSGLCTVALAAIGSTPAIAPAQACPGQGSLPRAARLEPAPFALGCAQAPVWPAWHLWTPPYREPASRPGFTPGDATALPRWFVTWRCTGWLLLPVAPQSLATMGYVLDRPEWPCGTTP